MARGRVQEAQSIMLTMARINKRNVPKDFLEKAHVRLSTSYMKFWVSYINGDFVLYEGAGKATSTDVKVKVPSHVYVKVEVKVPSHVNV